MRPPCERQAIDRVHLRLLQRQGRWIDDDGFAAVPLDELAGVVRIRLQVRDPRHLAEGERVGDDSLVGGQFEGLGARRGWLAGTEAEGDAAETTEILHGAARVETADDLQHGPLPHAEAHEVGLRIEQDRPPDGVAPVVVVGQAAEARLHATGDHRHARKGLARP
ncbi:MAG: hypothetical protein LW698_09285, partial [Planctomycetaceae bacterium]|nr:hypothetical protein [Planctomycetaceae bacterium]